METKPIKIESIELVARKLGSLKNDVVFLGGAATLLLTTDKAAPTPRPTKDIDLIIELGSLRAYHKLSDQLRKLGFTEDRDEDAPICRWVVENIKCDFMPTEGGILGFSSKWYKDAIKNAVKYSLSSKIEINLITLPYFIVTKIEAFKDRGKGDFYGSPDFSDIIGLLDGRETAFKEIKDSEPKVRKYIFDWLSEILKRKYIDQEIASHFQGDETSQARSRRVLKLMKEMAIVK